MNSNVEKIRTVRTKKPRRIKPGSTMRTRDEFLASGKGKQNIKPTHPNPKDLYRRIAVIETDKRGNAMIVKLTTKGKHKLINYENGKSTYKPFVEIYDDEGNFIKPTIRKFEPMPKKYNLSIQDTQQIYNDCFVRASPKTKSKNLKLLNELKKSNKKRSSRRT